MLYQIDQNARTAKRYAEPHTRLGLPCRTGREMRALYPDGDFLIVGEIGVFARLPADGDMLLTGDGTAVRIYPRGSLTHPFEWVAGYIPLEGSAYAAAVTSLFPAVLRRWAKAAKI